MAGPDVMPLYAEAVRALAEARRPRGAHAGLWYDKFYRGGLVAADEGKKRREGKGQREGKGSGDKGPGDKGHRGWIETVTREPIGDRSMLEEWAGRRCLLVESVGGELGRFEATARFVTGLGRAHPVENGFAWHPILGTPYLPGSSIKGVVRAWARAQGQDPARVDRLLGTPGRVGQVAFVDALPVAPVALEADVMTPHYGPYYLRGEAPGDWHSPVPVVFLVAGAGLQLHTGVIADATVPADQRGPTARTAMDWLACALDELGAGAKTAVGYGRFRRIDWGDLGEPWVADLRARQQAAMTPLDRARQEVAAMSEQDAMACVRKAREGRDERDPEEREALRQALRERYLEAWNRDGMHNVGKKKQRAYLQWLQGA